MGTMTVTIPGKVTAGTAVAATVRATLPLLLATLGLSLSLSLSAGCGDSVTGNPDPVVKPTPVPIKAPTGVWTWINIPDAICDDGTPTGIGVNLTGSNDFLVYMSGGGACWDYQSCFQLNFSRHGPFGANELNTVLAMLPSGTIFSRTLPNNPFANYNMVFVPYCTSDLHGGDNVVAYSDLSSGAQRVQRFKGYSNVANALYNLGASFPSANRVVAAGSSAGGYGSVLTYPLFHKYLPKSKIYLLDDSGPLFIGDAIQQLERAAWYSAWNLTSTQAAVCPACLSDMSLLAKSLATAYPQDRMALLSYTQDSTIELYLQQTAAQFQTNLYALAAQRLDPLPNFHYYFVTGTSHTFLPLQPGSTTAQGVPLLSWLSQFVNDNAGWTSTKP